MHIKPPKRPFDSIVLYLIEAITQVPRKTHMCKKKSHSNSHTPPKTAETCVQAYLLHVYITFGLSLTLIIDNRNELKYKLFQKCASKLGIVYQFLSPCNPQPNCILGKFHSFLKACVRNASMVN